MSKKLKEFLNLDYQIHNKCLSYQAIRIKTDHPKMDFIYLIWKMGLQRNNYLWSLESLDKLAMLNYTDINSLGNQSIMHSYIFHHKKKQGKQKRQ
ncbi:unnamed protein product [Paramecium primaurelia]|uniref:Uncharacterized protein n=1 Tax=Paramecium primaurelia TaxID=5886 RepID=A0A8S1Q1B6_PARPR|nr:unnamed protein product [Paramecium primaurelia]